MATFAYIHSLAVLYDALKSECSSTAKLYRLLNNFPSPLHMPWFNPLTATHPMYHITQFHSVNAHHSFSWTFRPQWLASFFHSWFPPSSMFPPLLIYISIYLASLFSVSPHIQTLSAHPCQLLVIVHSPHISHIVIPYMINPSHTTYFPLTFNFHHA